MNMAPAGRLGPLRGGSRAVSRAGQTVEVETHLAQARRISNRRGEEKEVTRIRCIRGIVGSVSSALFAVLAAAPIAQAHNHQPPWLDESTLDGGVHVAINHARVIRAPGPVDITVTLRNIAGAGDVVVQNIRYRAADDDIAETRQFARTLPTRRAEFLLYKAAFADMHACSHTGNTAGVRQLARECRNLLQTIAAEALTDHYRVPATRVPSEPGTRFHTTVEIALIQDGHHRTIRRDVDIPVQPPLPTGTEISRTWTYDVPTQTLSPDDRLSLIENAPWHAGDQHLHTTYSLDALALEGTTENVADYASAAELIGLDWIIVTDHSNVHASWGGTDYYTPEQFAEGTAQAAAYSAANPLLALYGEEMGAGQTGLLALPSHYLAYPYADDSTGYLANPSSGLVFGLANCEPEQTIIDRINAAGGFGFIAHPFDSGALAFAEWDFGNGATGWSGLEIWSDTNGQIKTTDDQALAEWYNLLNGISAPQQGHLATRPGFPNAFPVGLGNSDAHVPELIGSTFTYAWMPTVSREQVTEALSAGRCVASNGPLLSAEINGARIGEVALLLADDNDLDLTLTTTAEFGPVGDYSVALHVNGVVRALIPPTDDPGFSMNVRLDGLNLTAPDKFVTLRADSTDDSFHALTNPIWLQFTDPGDADADGSLTIADFQALADCLSGPDLERQPACDVMDIDRDRDVDLADLQAFQSAFTGF